MRIALFTALRNPVLLGEGFGVSPLIIGKAPPDIRGIATHADEVERGDLFAALAGKHVSGTAFIKKALSLGAAAILAPLGTELPRGDYWAFLVSDVSAAILRAAGLRRALTGARVIAVSGSVGKTTVKEVIAAVLREVGSVCKSEGNFNSTLGMPLSLLSMEEASYFVLELGINHKGEMAVMSRTLQPNIAVLTNVGTAHIGHFSGEEELLFEKLSIAAGQRPEDILILNENIDATRLSSPFPRIFRVGVSPTADVVAQNVVCGKRGITLDVSFGNNKIQGISFGIAGSAGREVLSFGAAVGMLLGADEAAIRRGVAAASARLPHRREITVGAHLVLDDTYNASPEAMIAALGAFYYAASDLPRAAVLGDMCELGAHATALHERVGEEAAKSGIAALFAYGRYAPSLAAGAVRGGMAKEDIYLFDFGQERELCRALSEKLPKDTALLFKASRATALDRVLGLFEEGEN